MLIEHVEYSLTRNESIGLLLQKFFFQYVGVIDYSLMSRKEIKFNDNKKLIFLKINI